MTPKQRSQWAKAKRGRGRPSKPASEHAERVLVTMPPTLLKRADDLAKQKGVSRSQLVVKGLRLLLAAG